MLRDFLKLETIIVKEFNDGLNFAELKYFNNNQIFEKIFTEYNKDIKNCKKMKNCKKNRKFVYYRMQRLSKNRLKKSETISQNLNMSNLFNELTDFESTKFCKAIEEDNIGLNFYLNGENLSQILKEDELNPNQYQTYKNTLLNEDEPFVLEALLNINEHGEEKEADPNLCQANECIRHIKDLNDDELCALDVLWNLNQILKEDELNPNQYQTYKNTLLNEDEPCVLEALLNTNEHGKKKEADPNLCQANECIRHLKDLNDDELCALDVLWNCFETKENEDQLTESEQKMNNVSKNETNLNDSEICASNVFHSFIEASRNSRRDSIEKIVSYLQEVNVSNDFLNNDNAGTLNSNNVNVESILSGIKNILNAFKVDFQNIVDSLTQTLQLNANNMNINTNKILDHSILRSNISNTILKVKANCNLGNEIEREQNFKNNLEDFKLNSLEKKDEAENNLIDSNKTLEPFEDTNSNLNLSKFETYRKSPNPKESLKRNVVRPNKTMLKINRKFKTKIFDCEFKINPKLVFEAKDDPKLKLTKNKFIIDALRQQYLKLNNACVISFFCLKGLLSGLLAYGYCNFSDCAKYRFKVDFQGKVEVFRTGEIVHAKGQQRVAQIRGVTRKIVKNSLKEKSAYIYRREQILKAADEIVECGNMENIQNLSTLRKCKAEGNLDRAYNPDPFVDVFNMQQGKYKRYIQHLASPLTIYCWEKITFETLTKYPEILNDANRTIHFDATGQSIRQITCAEKRVLIYKMVLHIRRLKIVLPVVTAILSRHTLNDISCILEKLKQFCNENKLKWPFFERVCTDVSFALFGAVLKSCNNENVAQYLQSCFCYLEKPNSAKRPKIIVQWCKAHYMHIICKDLSNKIGKKNALYYLLKHVMLTAFDLKTLDECKYWFRNIFIILLFPKKNNIFYESYNKLRKNILTIKENEAENNCFMDLYDVSNLESIASGSPFKKIFLNVYKEVNASVSKTLDGVINEYQNNEICDLINNKYCPFIPMWTNIMGILIDPSGSHISNAPIEFNFYLQKHIILKGKSIRPGEFIKKDRIDNMSTLKEIRFKYNIFEKKSFPIDLDKDEQFQNEIEKLQGKSIELNKPGSNKDTLRISKDHDYTFIQDYLEPEETWNKKNATKQKAINTKHLSNAKNVKKIKIMSEDVQDIIKIDSDASQCDTSRIRKEHAYNTNIKPKQVQYKCVLLRFNDIQNLFYGRLKEKNLGFYNFLDLEDWLSLNNNNMLTNLVLDNAILCILKENFKNTLSLPCQIDNICFEKVKALASVKPQYIIIPILKNIHFNLCILNFLDKKFIFIDSKYDNNGKYFYDKFISSLGGMNNWEYTEIYQRYKQTDGFSCGIYVIIYLLHFLQEKSLMDLPIPNEFRKTIRSLLIRNSDCSSLFCCHCGNIKRARSKCKTCNYWVCKPCQTQIYKRFVVCKICSDNIMP